MTNILSNTALAEGDQFLDGIGETALIARYIFDGNLEDWSRNSLHAAMENGEAVFVDDEQFGKVLALPGGKNGNHVRIPGHALEGSDSLSVTGWVKMDGMTPWQRLFDLGTDMEHRFHCTPVGKKRENGCSTGVTTGGASEGKGIATFRVAPEKWVHLASVLDAADKSLSLYVDGVCIGRIDEVSVTMEDVLDSSNPKHNRLLIGGSLIKGDPALDGNLHDIRFYRTALTDRQVAAIHHNAISDEKIGGENENAGSVESARADRARQLVDGLVGVEHVEVETPIGCLPHLPYLVSGIYQDNAAGPAVRVIWPAPKDNDNVLKTGTYTVIGEIPGTDLKPKATVRVVSASSKEPLPVMEMESFPLDQVVLNPDEQGHATPFMQHRDKFITGLAASNPDTFLYNFRDAFGQPQPDGTEPLYGWDSQTTRLRGHASGHYLTAIAQACASTTYDPELHALFAKKMDYMVSVLYDLAQMSGKPEKAGGRCTADPTKVPHGKGRKNYDSNLSEDGIRTDYWNWGEGFISGYPPDQFIMLEHGASYGTGNDQIWAPYYTLHKILAGLMDCYEVGGNPKALDVAKGMGLWVYKRLDELPAETRTKMWNSYIAGEYGGMNESMARLFQMTGDQRFLKCAILFDNTELFFGDADHNHGLACNVDTIRGKHANQHIPQITGALETYKGSHDPAYYHVVENFWERCTHSYMYSIGGVAGARNPNNAECFIAEPDTLFRNGISDGGQNETCATYNLLKLGRQLFMFERDAAYMDYYERALYNHILASVAENDAGNTYHVPLNPGAVKSFGNAQMNSFTCCNGTALESATKLQNTIYLKTTDDSAVYINLYVPSTLDWNERNVKITQATSFPYSDKTVLTVNGKGEFSINLRVPEWATHGFLVWINDEPQVVNAMPGSYCELQRTWNDGDTIQVEMAMGFHLMPLMDQPNLASIFYGPVLLAAEEPEPRSDWRKISLDPDYIGLAFKGDPSTLSFEADGIRFKPFYETYGRHSVYLEIVPKRANGNTYPPIQAINPPEKDFYSKQLDFHGIPIKSSGAVDDRALYAAYDRLDMMLTHLPEAQKSLAEAGAELHIIGRDEVTTDLPEFRDMKGIKVQEYGGLTYDERTRGLGGLLTSCGEENLLRLPKDSYYGTDICVHEFAHNVMYHGAPPELIERVEAQRKRSLEKGLWVGSYAGSNVHEFFAELTMWYFGTHGSLGMEGTKPGNGPEGLKAYDPEAYELLDDFWSGRL